MTDDEIKTWYPEKEKVRKWHESNDFALEVVKTFAEDLFSIVKGYRTKENQALADWFKCDPKDLVKMREDFPTFMRTQAIYAINMMIENNAKISKVANFDDYESSPTFESIRVSRDVWKQFLTDGYIFFVWKKSRFVAEIYFYGMSNYFIIYSRKRDVKKAEKFLSSFREFMKDNNIFKGEKLVFLREGFIDFLEFPELTWKDVILSDEMKEEFDINVLYPLRHSSECITKGIPFRRGLLLAGVAGTGKTQVCRVLCNELKDVTVIWATPKALYSEDMVKELFEAARHLAPTLIVIEDIDFIGTDRNVAQNPILGELLTQLDGNSPNFGVFVIATTNRPTLLDKALVNRPSRFDVKIEFSLPNEKIRVELVKLFTRNMKFEDKINYEYIGRITDGLTGSHIKEAFVYAQLKALKEGRKGIRMKDVEAKVKKFKQTRKNRLVS